MINSTSMRDANSIGANMCNGTMAERTAVQQAYGWHTGRNGQAWNETDGICYSRVYHQRYILRGKLDFRDCPSNLLHTLAIPNMEFAKKIWSKTCHLWFQCHFRQFCPSVPSPNPKCAVQSVTSAKYLGRNHSTHPPQVDVSKVFILSLLLSNLGHDQRSSIIATYKWMLKLMAHSLT